MQSVCRKYFTPEKHEQAYIIIDDDSEQLVLPSKKPEKNLSPDSRSSTGDSTTKPQIHKRLRKFNDIVGQYRKYQAKPGKEPKISELRQVHVPVKRSRKEAKDQPKMKTVWDPCVLPECEINEYLDRIKSCWPNEICRFNEEIALKYLKHCSYFPALALNLRQNSGSANFLRVLCKDHYEKAKDETLPLSDKLARINVKKTWALIKAEEDKKAEVH